MEKNTLYRQAVTLALADAMRADDNVLLMGEDIGASGGVFKTTDGLLDEFGPDRVLDTPISEMAFVGAGMGLALTGYRPVVEIMFADFFGVCYDQIVNNIAKQRYMSGGQFTVPMVIRTLGGGGLRFGAQHSQTAESWFLSVPGIKIFCPSCPQDAYSLLRAAIQDDDPVIVLEHKALLSKLDKIDFVVPESPIGPVIRRQGTDVTVVATLAMVGQALEAAEILSEEDSLEVEVIDLRVLRPLDIAPVVKSVEKTNRLLTVEEQHEVGGWGAEVVSQVTANCFESLDGPPARVTLPDHPLAYSPVLEDDAIPSASRIAREIKQVLDQ